MAQPAPYNPNNQQPTYGNYDYSSSINPNIPNNSGIRGNYEPARGSSFVSSPTTRITFKQPGAPVSTSKVITNPVRYTPNIQPQTSSVVVTATNPQTVNVSRTEVIERPVQVRTSTVQQAAAPQASQNYGGARTSYAVPSPIKPVEDHYPKWVWPTVALFGVLFLTLGLLWGLGVFGGAKIVTLPASTVASARPQSSSQPFTSSSVVSPNSTANLSPGPTVAAPSATASTPAPPPAPARIYPASIPPQTVAPVQVGSFGTTPSPSAVQPTTTATQPTTPGPPTQPTYTNPPTQPTYTNPPTQPAYINAIPASVAPMTATPTTTTTTQVTTIQPTSIAPTAVAPQQTSAVSPTTQPTSTSSATTQPTSTTASVPPTTTVTTTVTTKPV